MHKKMFVSLGLIIALSAAAVPAMADTTIYTDNIGRMHFLGRDAASNTGNRSNYTNAAEQELTRKLYSETGDVKYDESFNQHPVKNYENTFPNSRFTTSSVWKQQYQNNTEASKVDKENLSKVDTSNGIPVTSERANKKLKTEVAATRGDMYGNNPYKNNVEEGYTNVIKDKKTKKHWWEK